MAIATTSPPNVLLIREPDPIGHSANGPSPLIIKKKHSSISPSLKPTADFQSSASAPLPRSSSSPSPESSPKSLSSSLVNPKPKSPSSLLHQSFSFGASTNPLLSSSRSSTPTSDKTHPASSITPPELAPRSISPMSLFPRSASSSPTPVLGTYNRSSPGANSGRHRRKSSVSISPPFSRCSSPTSAPTLSSSHEVSTIQRPANSVLSLPHHPILLSGFSNPSPPLSSPSSADEDLNPNPRASSNPEPRPIKIPSDSGKLELTLSSEYLPSDPLTSPTRGTPQTLINPCQLLTEKITSRPLGSPPLEDATEVFSSTLSLDRSPASLSSVTPTAFEPNELNNQGRSTATVSAISIPLPNRSRMRSRSTTQGDRPTHLDLSSDCRDDPKAGPSLSPSRCNSIPPALFGHIARPQISSKRTAPARLDLGLSSSSGSKDDPKRIPAQPSDEVLASLCPKSSDATISTPEDLLQTDSASCGSSNSSSSSDPSCSSSSTSSVDDNSHMIIQPEDDLVIEDEERKAAEWMGCSTDNQTEGWSQESVVDDPGQFYDPSMLMTNGESEETGLSTMEKIFLFAKSENSFHRVIVSQRLPELLEEVDITEAVEYVLPLLSGLASDEEAVQEALAPSFCNIMWYYFTRCRLDSLSQSSSNLQNFSDDPYPAVGIDCTEIDWDPNFRRKRPKVSVSSFTGPIMTMLADSNLSVSMLTRYGLSVFLCRLMDRPFPSWPDDVLLISSEPFLPVEDRTPEDSITYKEYDFEEPIRKAVALELTEAIVSQLCQQDQVSLAHARDGPGESESEEWDTVPLVGEEIDLGPQSHIDPHGEDGRLDNAIFFDEPNGFGFSSADSDSFLQHLPRRRTFGKFSDEPMDMSNDPQNLRRQTGMSVIESIIQTGCFETEFLNSKILPEITKVRFDVDSRAVRQQAACALMTFMEAIYNKSLNHSSNDPPPPTSTDEADVRGSLLECYSRFATDLDFDVRKQICLALPAMARLIRNRTVLEKITLHYLDYFSKDEVQEVRIVGCQVLGELIHLFHELRCTVPQKLAGYFIQATSESSDCGSGPGGLLQLGSFGKSMDLAGSLMRGYEGFGLSSGSGCYQSFLSSQLTLSSPHSAEQTEKAMSCAYNFPAVLLSLGIDRWQELRDLFIKLATDCTYPAKVRKSLACSIHEFFTIIKAHRNKTQSQDGRDRSPLKNQRLALEDCLKVLRFFLFSDEDSTMIESVFENFDTSFENLVAGDNEDGREAIEILKGLNDYFIDDEKTSARTVNWRFREQVLLLLPKLLNKLTQSDRSRDGFLSNLLWESLRLFENLLFSGLRDRTAAVREAALKLLPILFDFQRPDMGESRLRLLKELKQMGQDSNYRIRANYPSALLSLVKLPMPQPLFESSVLDNVLFKMSDDRVGGVRICLSRLVNEVCTSKHFYGIESHRRIPLLIRKIIDRLSSDSEMVVCSYVEDLKASRNEDFHEEPEIIERSRSNEEDGREIKRGLYHDSLAQTPRLARSFESMTASDSGTRAGSIEDDEDDDLTGSGIQVFENRLSEDEGEEVSLGEDQFHVNLEILQDESPEEPTISPCSPQSPISLLGFDDVKIPDACSCSADPSRIGSAEQQRSDPEPAEEQLAQRLGGYDLEERTERDDLKQHESLARSDDLYPLTMKTKLGRPDPRRRGTTEGDKFIHAIMGESDCLQSKKRAVSSPSAINSLWPFNTPPTSVSADAVHSRLKGSFGLTTGREDYELDYENQINSSNNVNNNNDSSSNRKALAFGTRTELSPNRRNNRRTISHNQVVGGGGYGNENGGVIISGGGGGGGKRRNNGNSHINNKNNNHNKSSSGSNGHRIDALWMRDTDGGFVEVGEY